MKITHFHSISSANFEQFKFGDGKLSGAWMCSDQDKMSYLWSVEFCAENQGYELSNIAEGSCSYGELLQHPAESAIIQCALQGEKEFYILCLNIPDDCSELEQDYSCENMQGAYCIPENSLKDHVIGYYKCQWNSFNAPFVIKCLLNNTWFNSSMVDAEIMEVAEQISGDCFIDTAFEFSQSEFIPFSF